MISSIEFSEYVHNSNDFEIISSLGSISEQFAMMSNHPAATVNAPQTPTPSATVPSNILRSNSILKTQGIENRVARKRINSFEEDDFPPLNTPYMSRRSGKRLQVNQPSNLSRSISERDVQQVGMTRVRSNSSFPSVTFQPQFIHELQSLQFYLQSTLPLPELIQTIDYQIQQINQSQPSFCGGLFQPLYSMYNNLQYSWKLLYTHQNAQCELKVQIYRASLDANPSYVLDFDYVTGDHDLFESFIEEMKRSILQQEDDWENGEIFINLTSQCSLKSSNSENCCYELLQQLSVSRGVSASFQCQDEASLIDFYLDPTNINQLSQWILQIYQYSSLQDQQEAFQQILQICSVSCSNLDKDGGKMLKLLEKLHLIEALMTVFTPSVQSSSTAMDVITSAEDCFDATLPYVIQLLMHFTQSEDAVRLMVKDGNFINFLTTITLCSASTLPSLKWAKLISDCQLLAEELVKMIAVDSSMEEEFLIGQHSSLHSFTVSPRPVKCR